MHSLRPTEPLQAQTHRPNLLKQSQPLRIPFSTFLPGMEKQNQETLHLSLHSTPQRSTRVTRHFPLEALRHNGRHHNLNLHLPPTLRSTVTKFPKRRHRSKIVALLSRFQSSMSIIRPRQRRLRRNQANRSTWKNGPKNSRG